MAETVRLAPAGAAVDAIWADRAQPFYVSADSAPPGYAVRRSAWLAPLVLQLLVVAAVATAPALPTLTRWYADVVADASRTAPEHVLGAAPTISFRVLMVAFLALVLAFAVGSVRQRVRVVAYSQTLLWASFLLVDIALARAPWSSVPAPLSPVGGVLAGFAGLLVLVFVVFTRFELPAGVRVKTRFRRSAWSRWLRTVVVCLAGIGIMLLAAELRDRYFADLHVRFVGGLDSEFVVALLAIVCLLSALSRRDRRARPSPGPSPSVAFLVPACNEASGIRATIEAIDAAAARYDGFCRLYVVDNASTDDTRLVAKQALASCAVIRGLVLGCPVRGKSHALNYGLSHITEDVVVRIDADTLVEPDLLARVVPWFRDPTVGGVSGLPLPKRTSLRWLYPLRLIEVYYGVAFLRVAQGAVDGIMVMPGLVACYRRELVKELGGFGEGFNGEDADITMRLGRLGYRIVTDPRVRVLTEVPGTLGHLREQRQRWARGLFHMAGRNLSCISMGQGARGLWILPWSIVNGFRRVAMVPVLLAAAAVEVVDPSVFSLREVSVVAGFVVGLQAFVIAAVLVVHRQLRALPWIPLYLVFRLARAYFAFEALLTLQLKSSRSVRVAAPTWDAGPDYALGSVTG